MKDHEFKRRRSAGPRFLKMRHNVIFGLLFLSAGCEEGSTNGYVEPNDPIEADAQTKADPLTIPSPSDICMVLDFESLDDWHSDSGGLSLSDITTRGDHSLAVEASNYKFVESVETAYSGSFETVSLDVKLPETAVNPWWQGDVQLYLDMKSGGVYSAYLGIVSLQGLAPGKWHTVTFTVPIYVQEKLKGDYEDLVFRLALNTPEGAGEHLLDNLRIDGLRCSEVPEDNEVIVSDGTIALTATRWYSPDNATDGTWLSSVPEAVAIPAQIPVVFGNAANGTSTLTLAATAAGTIVCTYQGGSTTSHPTAPIDVVKGRAYHFVSCSGGFTAGDSLSITAATLHIDAGDAYPGVTRVGMDLGGTGSRTLEPPISAVTSVTLRESFDWASTTALPETNTEGHPALYSALIYIEAREQREALEQMFIHYNTLPIFEDMSRWRGKSGIFENEGDGQGMFVFAVIPGITYNMIREAAVGGEAVFRALIIQDPPSPLRLTDGSLSYEALMQAGFVYEADTSIVVDNNPASGGSNNTATPAAGGFGLGFIKKIVRAVAVATKFVVQGAQQILGAVDRFINGSATLTVHLNVRNTDPAFGGDISETKDESTPMTRAWGVSAGSQVQLPGVRVEVRQPMPLISKLFVGHTDADSNAPVKVTTDRSNSVCIETANSGALVTKWLFPAKVCDFGTFDNVSITEDTNLDLIARAGYINVLAQASEGHLFLKDVVDHDARQAEIMVGGLADFLGLFNEGAAFAPGFGFQNSVIDGVFIAVGLSAAMALGPPAAAAVAAAIAAGQIVYGDVDIFLPTTKDSTSALTSRGVVTHEYGHFALYSMLNEMDSILSDYVYTRMIIERLFAPEPDAAGGMYNEAFADFFASQVAGGTNYFNAASSQSRTYEGISYYLDGAPGMDVNGYQSDTYEHQIGRTATMLHDAVDGHGFGVDEPSNTGYWKSTTFFTGPPAVQFLGYSNSSSTDSHDEDVMMDGRSVYEMLEHVLAAYTDLNIFPVIAALALPGTPAARTAAVIAALVASSSFTIDDVFASISDTAADAGYDWCQRCVMLSLQDPEGHPNYSPAPSVTDRYEMCRVDPIADWVGAEPDPDDPSSCHYSDYPFEGCRGTGTSICDELVDPLYYSRHPDCTRNPTCEGEYFTCDNSCPKPESNLIPNAVVRAEGHPTPAGRISVGYSWSDWLTGGFHYSDVTQQDWVEFELGAGVNVPDDGREATVNCTTSSTEPNSGYLSHMSVLWNNGNALTIACEPDQCYETLPLSGGFVATCYYVSP